MLRISLTHTVPGPGGQHLQTRKKPMACLGSLELSALGPRAQVVAWQSHSEHLQLREPRQAVGQVLGSFVASEPRLGYPNREVAAFVES